MAKPNRGMISLESYGSTKHIRGFFSKVKQKNFVKELEIWGEIGAQALAMETPVDTGRAASSWGYEIEQNDGSITLYWTNDDIEGGQSVVLLIQYGHGTRGGAYVAPYDFINPVTKELFGYIADSIWKEVVRL